MMVNNRKYLGKLALQDYPRQIELSKSQRPKYWEWNNVTIKSGSKKLLQKFINPNCKKRIINRNGNIHPSDLKAPYAIVEFKGTKPYCIFESQNNSTEIVFALTTSQLKKPSKYFLCDISLKDGKMNIEKVIANPTKVGEPRMHIISGQDFHVGLNPHIRTKVIDTLHEYYYNAFKSKGFQINFDTLRTTLNENYPLYIEMEIKDTVKSVFDNTKKGNGKHWDVGNRALPYMKTFYDFLDKGCKDLEPFIEDDDRLHITSGNNAFFTPIEENEIPTLVFHFYTDTREIFKKYLKC